MDKITDALLILIDALGYDHAGCVIIDEAQNDDDLKKGVEICLKDLDKQGKIAITKQVRDMLTGWL